MKIGNLKSYSFTLV